MKTAYLAALSLLAFLPSVLAAVHAAARFSWPGILLAGMLAGGAWLLVHFLL